MGHLQASKMWNFNVDDFGPEWFQCIDSSLAAIYHNRFSIVEIVGEYTQTWDLWRVQVMGNASCGPRRFLDIHFNFQIDLAQPKEAGKRGVDNHRTECFNYLQLRFQSWGKTSKLQAGGKIRYLITLMTDDWIYLRQYGSSPQHVRAPSTSHFKKTPTFKVLLKENMWPYQGEPNRLTTQNTASQTWSHCRSGEKRTPFRLEFVKSFLWAKQWYNQWVCSSNIEELHTHYTPKQLEIENCWRV